MVSVSLICLNSARAWLWISLTIEWMRRNQSIWIHTVIKWLVFYISRCYLFVDLTSTHMSPWVGVIRAPLCDSSIFSETFQSIILLHYSWSVPKSGNQLTPYFLGCVTVKRFFLWFPYKWNLRCIALSVLLVFLI